MDPLSIIAVVLNGTKALFGVTNSVLTFIDEVKNVDSSIHGIYDEVNSLSGTLEAIKGSLTNPSIALVGGSADDNERLWLSVLDSLREGEVTIKNLYACLDSLKRQGSGTAQQTVAAIKFNNMENQLQTLKGRVQTHNTALQLALQTITVLLCSRTPSLVISDLGKKIELLVDMIAQIDTSHDQAAEAPTAGHTSTRDSLLISAQQVALGADRVLSESESGSIFGGSLRLETRSRIEEWIEAPNSTIPSMAITSGSAPSQTQMTPSGSIADETDRTEVGPSGAFDNDGFELELEEIEASLKAGQRDLEKLKYSAAILFFRRACSMAKVLHISKQNKLSLKDVQLKIAVCCFHLKRFEEAETAVQLVKEYPVVSQDDKIRSMDATHLLAEIYLGSQKLDKAERECRTARTDRYISLGKDHSSHYESLSLLSVILEMRGDGVYAEIYRTMIPEEVTDPLVQARRSRTIDVLDDTSIDQVNSIGGNVGNITDISAAEMASGIKEIKEKLIVGQKSKYNAGLLLLHASDQGLYGAVHLLLTGWSPTTDILLMPGYQDKSIVTAGDVLCKWKPDGQTVLHTATRRGHLRIVELLLEAGADIHARDDYDNTPFHLALQSDTINTKLVQLLLQRGADIVSMNKDRQYPPIYNGDYDCIRYCHSILLEEGLDTPWHQRERGFALHRGVQQNLKDLVNLMLDSGVDVAVRDSQGRTPLAVARSLGYKTGSFPSKYPTNVTDVLLSRGAIDEFHSQQEPSLLSEPVLAPLGIYSPRLTKPQPAGADMMPKAVRRQIHQEAPAISNVQARLTGRALKGRERHAS